MNKKNFEGRIIWYLEMMNVKEFKPKSLPKYAEVIKLGIPLPIINSFFYKEVGGIWKWTDRSKWTLDNWNEWVERENLQTWILLFHGTPAGYFELEIKNNEVEIAFFGLLYWGKATKKGDKAPCFDCKKASIGRNSSCVIG